MCLKLGLGKYAAKADISSGGLLVYNFTSVDCFFESFEQSGHIGETEDARAAELLKLV